MVVKIERKRYFLVKFSGDIPEKRQLIRKLRDKVAFLGGQIALARSSLHVIDVVGSHAIIRANHYSRDIVEVALQLLQLPNSIPNIITVSGTIKKITSVLDIDLIDVEDDITDNGFVEEN